MFTDPQQSTYAYLRKSRAEEDDPEVLALHRSALLDLAERDGHQIPEANIYAEIGSADEITSRPAFLRLLEVWRRLPRGTGGVVYCMEIARLSRGLQSQQGQVQDALARAAIIIRTPRRFYDMRIDEDAMVFEMEGFVARQEWRNTQRRYQNAMNEIRRQGRSTNGKACFGYRWNKEAKTFIPQPDEFPILQAFLRDLFQMSLLQAVAKYGISLNIIRGCARNPIVCGWAPKRHDRHHGEKDWVFPFAKLPRDQWIWPEKAGTWPMAISRPDWEALQEVIDRRYINREKQNSDAGWCRDVLQFRNHPGRVKMGSHRWGNSNVLTYEIVTPEKACLYIPREIVHTAAERLLLAALGPASDLPGLLVEAMRADHPAPSVDLPEIERQLARLRAQLDSVNLGLVDPDADTEKLASLTRVEKQLTAQIKARREELQRAQAAVLAVPRLEGLLDEIPALQANFPGAWAAMDDHSKRQITAAFISLIEATIEPTGRRAHRREVTACVPADWLARTMRDSEAR